ncbi:hypothetical protein ACP8HI_01980 [Paenibacillus sp. FA6]
MKEVIPDRNKWTNFVTRLEALLTEHNGVVELKRIGFPEDWEFILMTWR